MTDRLLPLNITAGLNFELRVELADYLAPAWSVQLLLRGPKAITLTSTADGEAHVLSANAATTTAWTPGEYVYSLRATNGTDVVEVEAGSATVKPDITGMADGTDVRGHIRKVLESIEAVIERRATRDQERYTINNRELWRTPIADLLKLRSQYREELRRANAAARGESPLLGRVVRVHF